MHLRNSFISTTRCDDLARATEAQDGKKPHEDLDPDILAEEQRQQALLASQPCSKKQIQSTRAPSASSGAPSSKAKTGKSGWNKAVSFQ